MQYNLNVVGKNIAKFRQQRGWTQKELAAKLQLLGCNITRQILANVEARRCAVTDAQIAFFAGVFCVPIKDLFPSKSQSGNRKAWLMKHRVTRPLRRSRFERSSHDV
jgi:transcriptional regulator with XRE-family HTH domain